MSNSGMRVRWKEGSACACTGERMVESTEFSTMLDCFSLLQVCVCVILFFPNPLSAHSVEPEFCELRSTRIDHLHTHTRTSTQTHRDTNTQTHTKSAHRTDTAQRDPPEVPTGSVCRALVQTLTRLVAVWIVFFSIACSVPFLMVFFAIFRFWTLSLNNTECALLLRKGKVHLKPHKLSKQTTPNSKLLRYDRQNA